MLKYTLPIIPIASIGAMCYHDSNTYIKKRNEQFISSAFYKNNIYTEFSGKKINEMTNNKTFYKCLAKNLKHYDHTYKLGLNTDTHHDFNPHNHCEAGGLYFTDEEKISGFLGYGPNLGNIKIPDDARCYLENDKIKCDKLILVLIESIENHELMKDPNFCLESVKHCGDNIKYIDKEILKNNVNICFEAVKNRGSSIRYIDNEILKNNIDVCLEAVKEYGNSVRFIDDEILKNNMNICIKAVKQDGHSIYYIDNDILKNNMNICIEAVKQNGYAIRHIDNDILKNNMNICIEAVKQNGYAIIYIDNEILKKHINIVVEAIKKKPDSINYIDTQILKDNVVYLGSINDVQLIEAVNKKINQQDSGF